MKRILRAVVSPRCDTTADISDVPKEPTLMRSTPVWSAGKESFQGRRDWMTWRVQSSQDDSRRSPIKNLLAGNKDPINVQVVVEEDKVRRLADIQTPDPVLKTQDSGRRH